MKKRKKKSSSIGIVIHEARKRSSHATGDGLASVGDVVWRRLTHPYLKGSTLNPNQLFHLDNGSTVY